MLNSRKYRNVLQLREGADPTERRENLTKEILKDSTTFPNPLTYKDIDQGMTEWCQNVLSLSFEGEEVPTVVLYTNQRFEEYMQAWQHTDNKKNFLMNFKTITRENNPKKGTVQGHEGNNTPGDRFYTMRREKIVDKNGQNSFIEYKMKQPFGVDLSYKISIVTSKYELINDFNTLLMSIFKAGYNYFNVKGHYLYIKLEDTSDDSEYAIDDRRFFSQTAKFTVKAYIIREEDFIVEEKPVVKFKCLEGEQRKNALEAFSEEDALVEDAGLYYKPLTITLTHAMCDEQQFKAYIPYNMVVKKTILENINRLKITIDGEDISDFNNFEFIEGEAARFNVTLRNGLTAGKVIFYGYDKDSVYETDYAPDNELDNNQLPEEAEL